VLEVSGNRVRLGLGAHDDATIVRHELLRRAAGGTQLAGPGSSAGDNLPCPCL
jgi:hypothetical protein